MNVNDLIVQGGGIASIARELGVDEGTAQAGVGALLPAVLGGFKGQAQTSPQGLGGLLGMVQGMGGGGLLDSVLGNAPTDTIAGNNVLGSIFGSKETSRAVAADASVKSGVSSDLLKRMLPLVAMLVAGYMAKHSGEGQPQASGENGGIGGMLGSVLGGVMGGGGAPAGAGGFGGIAAMLDMDHDGNPLNDIMGMAGKLGR